VAVKKSRLAIAVAAIAIVGPSANQCTNEQPSPQPPPPEQQPPQQPQPPQQ